MMFRPLIRIMKYPLSCLVALAFLVFSLSAQGKVIHVNEVASLGGDGTSWPTACRYLQDALDLTVAGDEVWVAAGTYYPDQGASVTTGDRTASFTLKQDVKLYGGFAGGETALGQQDPETNLSLLSGEIWTEQIYWSLHVVTLGWSATLDGITVAKGNANGDTAPYNQGGGILVSGGNIALAINRCNFTTNSAASGGAIYSSTTSSLFTSSVTATNCTFFGNSASSGGAVYSYSSFSSSTVKATNCVFSGNSASAGGAIYSSSSPSSVVATNCTFFGNTASSYGGAIVSPSSGTGSSVSTVTATECTFSDNTASSGGAVATLDLTATNCTFSGNTASSYGGAINTYFKVKATNCMFSGNTASSSGGAIYANYSSEVTATNCTFSSNTASSSGGAVYGNSSSTVTATACKFSGNSASSGGAIYTSLVTATNCTFSSNSASSGGAIYTSLVTATNCTFSSNSASSFGGAIYTSSVTVTNCTLINNLARGTGKKGGVIYALGLVKFMNNVLWHTLAEAQNNLIYITSAGSLRNSDSAFPSPLNQAKNLIKGGMSAITVEAGATVTLGDTAMTILSNDPLFVHASDPVGPDGIWGTADDGLRLQEASPAQNLGLSMFLPVDIYDLDKDGDVVELIPIDLAGYTRIQGGALDLGAYEAADSTGAGTTYASWASLHNLTGEYALSTANPSRDGVNNLIKYALGLDPEVPTLTPTDGVNPGLPQMEVSGGTMTFTFIKDTAKTDLTYTVESCTELDNWTSVTTGIAETPLTGALVRIVVTIPVSEPQFFRLKVTK
jgi:parallel beta-helix repeat protein/predicted outer membrane repeat protein